MNNNNKYRGHFKVNAIIEAPPHEGSRPNPTKSDQNPTKSDQIRPVGYGRFRSATFMGNLNFMYYTNLNKKVPGQVSWTHKFMSSLLIPMNLDRRNMYGLPIKKCPLTN